MNKNALFFTAVALLVLFLTLPEAGWAQCYTYTDNFSSAGTAGNYDYRDSFSGTGTAASTGYNITGGYLETSGGTSGSGGFADVNTANWPPAYTDYTIDADFEMSSYNWQGIFGIAFRTDSLGDSYTFQLNGYSGVTPEWQIEKYTVGGGFTYPGNGIYAPTYTTGTWIHLKVVVTGSNFQCYVDTGGGLQLIYNVNDTSFSTGQPGVRTYGISSTNLVKVANYTVTTCSVTATPTNSPTASPTPSPTNSPVITPVSSFTPTFTPSDVDVFYVSKNLFTPSQEPVSIYVQYNRYPGDYALRIYNSAGEKVRDLDTGYPGYVAGPIYSPNLSWDGKNNAGNNCASGVYVLYLIEPFDTKVKRVLLVR